jgi:thiol peroxidase
MAQTSLGNQVVHTNGDLPQPGSKAPSFSLAGNNLKNVSLESFEGKNIILNIFPSIDTSVCAMSVREFNKRATSLPDTVVLCVSKDLPFAMRRFCGAEGIENVITLSDFRTGEFARNYGVELMDGAFAGLMARAIFVLDKKGEIKYNELVPSIDHEPNYDATLKSL